MFTESTPGTRAASGQASPLCRAPDASDGARYDTTRRTVLELANSTVELLTGCGYTVARIERTGRNHEYTAPLPKRTVRALFEVAR